MKAIKCELCGSNELKKIDGEYECQYCHTKYSVEEAKKLMIDGTVDVQINTEKQEKNYEKLAERAYKDEQYKQAYDYYKKLLELDSDNWEYVYKTGICSAWQSTLTDFRIDEAIIAAKNAFKLVKDNNIEIEDMEEFTYKIAIEINNLNAKYVKIAQDNLMKHSGDLNTINSYLSQIEKCIACEEYVKGIIKPYIKENRSKKLYIIVMENLVVYYVEMCAIRQYVAGVSQYGDIYSKIWITNESRNVFLKKYDECVAELKGFNPEYEPLKIQRKAGGCYVATCVYGSYDCPNVWVLRRFRDNYLNNRIWGRAFIKVYYAVSPKIVKAVGKTKWFNCINKKILDKFVAKLKEKGYQDSKYDDIY